MECKTRLHPLFFKINEDEGCRLTINDYFCARYRLNQLAIGYRSLIPQKS